MEDDFIKNINELKKVIDVLVSQRNLAQTRASIAEKTLEDFRIKNQVEIKNAFVQGYKKGKESLSTDVQGGNTIVNDEAKKLVYNNN